MAVVLTVSTETSEGVPRRAKQPDKQLLQLQDSAGDRAESLPSHCRREVDATLQCKMHSRIPTFMND